MARSLREPFRDNIPLNNKKVLRPRSRAILILSKELDIAEIRVAREIMPSEIYCSKSVQNIDVTPGRY